MLPWPRVRLLARVQLPLARRRRAGRAMIVGRRVLASRQANLAQQALPPKQSRDVRPFENFAALTRNQINPDALAWRRTPRIKSSDSSQWLVIPPGWLASGSFLSGCRRSRVSDRTNAPGVARSVDLPSKTDRSYSTPAN